MNYWIDFKIEVWNIQTWFQFQIFIINANKFRIIQRKFCIAQKKYSLTRIFLQGFITQEILKGKLQNRIVLLQAKSKIKEKPI